MSVISTTLTRLRNAVWAIDVRDDIANAIEQCYSDVNTPSLREQAFIDAIDAELQNGHLTGLDLGDGDVTTSKIATGAVTTEKIADGSITREKLTNNALLTSAQITALTGLLN